MRPRVGRRSGTLPGTPRATVRTNLAARSVRSPLLALLPDPLLGALPCISEFSPSGQLLFNAKLPAGVSTYRADRLPWQPVSQAARGTPARRGLRS